MTGVLKQAAEDWAALTKSKDTAWGAVLKGYTGVKFTVVHLATSSEVFTKEAIHETIGALEKSHVGWSRRESWAGATPLVDGAPKDAGLPLEGEWVLSDTSSAQLLYLGNGQWKLITLTEGDSGTLTLREETSLCDVNGDWIDYAVYWHDRDGQGGITRLASRFLGFRAEPTK